MIDNFSILLSHGLLMFAFWILIQRADTDVEDPPTPDADPEGFAVSRVSNRGPVTPKNPAAGSVPPVRSMKRPYASKRQPGSPMDLPRDIAGA